MERFAFMVHAVHASDVARKYPFTRFLPERVVEAGLLMLPPLKTSRITGVRSPHGEAEGWFVGCPLTTRQMAALPADYVLAKIIATGRLAERLGAKILGLGAHTAVVGDAGITVAKALDIAVTTGNSYTVATAIEGAKAAAAVMGHDLDVAEVAVVGAGGSIGAACAVILGREVRNLTLIGRNVERLRKVAGRVLDESGLAVRIATDLKATLPRMDVIIAVSSAVDAIIDPEDLKVGAVVCDVARPRDVSRAVAAARDDVLVIDGGVIRVPGNPDFGMNWGYPPGLAIACVAETMILALEGRYEDFTLGRDLTVAQIDEIARLAAKHGFKLAGFRSFERDLPQERVEQIRRNAELRRAGRRPEALLQPA